MTPRRFALVAVLLIVAAAASPFWRYHRVTVGWDQSPGARGYRLEWWQTGHKAQSRTLTEAKTTLWLPRRQLTYAHVYAIGYGGIESEPSATLIVTNR